MLKIITPSSWQFDEPIAQMVKVSSRGLHGDDLASFVKRAGHRFADEIQNIELKPGDVPVHLIAIGATEYYGPNRNGDGFKEACCKDFHDTFVKHARWYRNHKNKDPLKSFGLVKASSYNDKMQRIELLVTLNSTDEAAGRNKGLLADEEMEKLSKGNDIAVSMACRVPFDVCSGCGNQAHNRGEYCDSDMCKQGGLRTKIGSVLEDGHILHADNPSPTFFDISKVFRPADRIAYVMGRLEKAASAGNVISGAQIAEEMELTAPPVIFTGIGLSAGVATQVKIAQQFIEAESGLDKVGYVIPAFYPGIRGAAVLPDVLFPTTTKVAQLTRALAESGIILPATEFLSMMHSDREKIASASFAITRHLPGIFARMLTDGSFETTARSNPYISADNTHMGGYRKLASNLAPDYSLDWNHVERRMQKAALRGIGGCWTHKESSHVTSGPGEELARQYAMYKVAAAQYMGASNNDLSLTLTLSILQNYI